MTATTAKLQHWARLAEIPCTCSPLGHVQSCKETTERGKLARLVLTLSETVDSISVSGHSEHESATGPSKYQDCTRWQTCIDANAAPAAVEELGL